jgi:hypothetical protein
VRDQPQVHKRDPRSLLPSALAVSAAGDRRGSILLLLSALAMAVLVIASLRLLRLLMRLNATSYGGRT